MVEIISTAGEAHVVRTFYSAFYRYVIWIYIFAILPSMLRLGKEKSATEFFFIPLKDLKLKY